MGPRVIAVVGPTASGKSALALRLAQSANGEIVSCDSLQVYRGVDVGSAKPGPAELRAVPHHLVDVVEPDQPFNAADWAAAARAALAAITARGRAPIIAGGTGLYLRALLVGLFAGPGRDPVLRARLEQVARRGGLPRLHRLLGRADPEAAARIHPADTVRVVRALEVVRASRRPISALQREGTEPLRGYAVQVIGLDPGRDRLRAAVERRTRAMLDGGLLEETARLLARYGPGIRALQAIGYRQALAVVQGRLDAASAQRDIVAETMRYAKRQRTWFRHQARVAWYVEAEEAYQAGLGWLQGAGV